MVADLTDLRVWSSVFAMFVSPSQYVYWGEVLCRPRDLVSLLSVIVMPSKKCTIKNLLATRIKRVWAEKCGFVCKGTTFCL